MSNSETQKHSTLSKPLVIPRKRYLTPVSIDIKLMRFSPAEISNIFNVKSLSPFPTSVYSSELERQQISEADLEQCIRGINRSLMSNPAFQLAFMSGGFLMGAQGILPVQVVGGAVQILSAGLSAAFSWYRVRKYIRDINNTLFVPKGLQLKVLTTDNLIKIIGYTTNAPPEPGFLEKRMGNSNKPRLALPSLSIADCDTIDTTTTTEGGVEVGGHVYQRRLEALSDLVAPLTIKDSNANGVVVNGDTEAKGLKTTLHGLSTKPLRWINERDIKRMLKARAKWVQETDPTKQSKKLKKIDRKEHKIANRVLWIVIMPLENDVDQADMSRELISPLPGP